MTESEQKELRNYCAFMLKEYGFDFAPTDPVIPALYVMHREILSNKKSNEAIAKEIKTALTKMNPNVYNFSSPGEAWKFRIASSLKWLFVGISFNLILWICLTWWSSVNELEKASLIIQSSEPIGTSLLKRVRKDDKGYLFLDFKEGSPESTRYFTDYEKVSQRTVRVYLGKEKY